MPWSSLWENKRFLVLLTWESTQRSARIKEPSKRICLTFLPTSMVSACASVLLSTCVESASFPQSKSWSVRFRRTRAVHASSCYNRLRASPTVSAQRFVVPPTQAAQRLDRFLASLTSATRSHIKLLIDHERVRVAGKPKKAGYLLRPQEEIEVLPLPAIPSTATPQEIRLDILYEDEFLAAINKPAGMVVHPAPGQWQGTVVNALLSRWGRVEVGDSLRPGIIHRLDKDTSGVLLVAKDRQTLERLARQFKERQVHKIYMAVVVGR